MAYKQPNNMSSLTSPLKKVEGDEEKKKGKKVKRKVPFNPKHGGGRTRWSSCTGGVKHQLKWDEPKGDASKGYWKKTGTTKAC